MAAELPRPGVEVIQVFRSVSPTVITPTLPSCCVGVCRQIVDVLAPTDAGGSTLNSDALVPLHAGFLAKPGVGTPAAYAGLDGLVFALSINYGPTISIVLAGALLSPKQVVAQILSAFSAAGVTAAVVELVGTTAWRLRTVAANEFQSIRVIGSGPDASDPAVLAAFGLGPDKEYLGASDYTQSSVTVGTVAFPDPRKNLSQLAIDLTTVRAFLFMGGVGGTLSEVQKNRSFLRSGAGKGGVLTGTADLSALTYGASATVNAETLIVTLNDGAPITVTFAAPADLAALLAQVNAVLGADATASVDGSNHLVITTTELGSEAGVTVGAGTANTHLGVTPGASPGTAAIRSIATGSGSTVTPLVQAPGADFTAAAAAASLVGTAVISGGVPDGLTLILNDGSGPQTLTFTGATNEATTLAAINGLFGASAGGQVMAGADGGHHLVLTQAQLGVEGMVTVVGGTALAALGLTGGSARGGAYPVRAGDEIYVDGILLGIVTQVAPGGAADTLKIDKQIAVSPSLGLSYYLVAKGLPAAGRPTPDLSLDLNGNFTIKQDLLRDTQGLAAPVAHAQIYLSYQAVRQDVSPLAKTPGLLRFNDTVALTSQLAPINANNPLALGLYFALLNSPQVQVTGIGVDAAGPGAPFGTTEAFARAAVFLEGQDIYAIAPLTHDPGVGQIFEAHVTAMSAPDQKGERIVLFNPSAPVARPDKLVGSGLNGNSTTTANQFDTGVANLGALLLAKGVSPVGALAVGEGVYLDVGDGKKYPIVAISSSLVTVRTAGFLPGENDDGYFAVTPLPTPLIAQAFAVRVRGEVLVLTDGTPDKEGIALTYQQLGQSHQNRRFWQIIADKTAATIGSIEQVVEGFYLSAATAGMIGKQPAHQSFTNFPIAGFTRVFGTNDFLSERQLNVVAAGGNYIITQEGDGTALFSRFALTTDMTSIETRTDMITKIVDFVAKFLRRGLRNFIGRFNITQGFLDSIGHVIQGLGGFLVENGFLVGFNLNTIVQDESAPDTVLVDVLLDVPFPCNYIRLTVVV